MAKPVTAERLKRLGFQISEHKYHDGTWCAYAYLVREEKDEAVGQRFVEVSGYESRDAARTVVLAAVDAVRSLKPATPVQKMERDYAL